jgi:sugar phosphate isomerase/epimerase
MPLTASDWPVAASLLPFPGVKEDGTDVQDADSLEWSKTLGEVAEAGFQHVDLLDSWVRIGDLSAARLDELRAVADDVGVGLPAVSVVRRSVVDAHDGDANLAYSHRTLEAAARIGARLVSFGLHQPLTAAQREQLWFWTVDGYKAPIEDEDLWSSTAGRLRELGRHADELGLLVSLEMYEDTFLGTADLAVRLVSDIDLPNVGLNPDLGNLVRLHRPVEDWQELITKTAPYANYWHVKNYFRDEDVARGLFITSPAPLELGVINYRKALGIALAAGFQGMFCTEHYGGDGLSVSARNQRYLREMVLPKTDNYCLGVSRVNQTGRVTLPTRR